MRFSRRPGRARVGTLEEISTPTVIMKTADANPYEFFRWKSSCGRLVVRTTWVSGVRHVLLSDDDKSPEKEKRLQLRRRATHVDRGTQSSRIVDDHKDEDSEHNYNDDENYVERVLKWLQKPSVELDARRKPMSASGSDTRGCRRPVLVKTFSIPERYSPRSEHRQAMVIHDERPTATTTITGVKSGHKTELHVHMPSVKQGGGLTTTADNGKITHNYECY